MKGMLSILLGVLVLIALAATAMLAWQVIQNRDLTASNSDLKQSLDTAHAELASVSIERESALRSVGALQDQERQLKEQIDSLKESTINVKTMRPRPYPVRAFLGSENIGQAWIVPQNVVWDDAIGRYTFEPVLVIDESARDYFTVHHTNVVERNFYSAEYYDDGYDPLFYSYYYAGGRPWKTNRPPFNPQPAYQRSGVPQQPDARAQVFAPPMSIVNSRPQVIGRPATSPINERVFAP